MRPWRWSGCSIPSTVDSDRRRNSRTRWIPARPGLRHTPGRQTPRSIQVPVDARQDGLGRYLRPPRGHAGLARFRRMSGTAYALHFEKILLYDNALLGHHPSRSAPAHPAIAEYARVAREAAPDLHLGPMTSPQAASLDRGCRQLGVERARVTSGRSRRILRCPRSGARQDVRDGLRHYHARQLGGDQYPQLASADRSGRRRTRARGG